MKLENSFLTPIGDDCIIHPFEYPTKIGSIWVPDRTRKRANQGIIIAKGPLVSDDLDTADHVFFNGYTGDQLAFEDHGKFFVIPESHIICKVNKSTVVLMDTETVKRIIQERMGELTSQWISGKIDTLTIAEVEKSLLDRIDTITIAEDWEF